MGTRGITNKGNRGVTLKDLTTSSYQKLATAAQSVHDKMDAAVATFATPAPTLADVQTATDTLVAAMQVMSFKRNRASKANTLAAQAAANDVRILLQQLMQYAVNTVLDLFPANSEQFNATLATAGFSIKNVRKPKHITQARFVTQSNSKKFPASMMRINWRRGTGLIKGAPIAGYLIKSVTKSRQILIAGYNDVLFTDLIKPIAATGLSAATDYNFIINVDGSGDVNVLIHGADAATWDDLINAINAAIVGAHCEPLTVAGSMFLRIISNTKGNNSSVVLSNSGVGDDLFPALTFYSGIDTPVQGEDVFVPSSFGIIQTTTKTNAILNPSMGASDNITGQIVPFNALGEGNPINFTALYII